MASHGHIVASDICDVASTVTSGGAGGNKTQVAEILYDDGIPDQHLNKIASPFTADVRHVLSPLFPYRAPRMFKAVLFLPEDA